MYILGNINLTRAIKLDENSELAKKDTAGQLSCQLHCHVKNFITQDNYDFMQKKECDRITESLDKKLFLSVDNDLKALYIDKKFISRLMDHAKDKPPAYLRGYQFLSNLAASCYFHLFELSDIAWIMQNYTNYQEDPALF